MTKPQFPVNYIGITQGFKGTAHKGIDLGWKSNNGGKNQAIVAPLDMTIAVNSYASDAGNFAVAKAYYDETQDYLFRFLHLKEKPNISIGQVINQGTPFALMGNTGTSSGNHLHFETWLVPKNYKYSFNDVMKYIKNPLEYVYLYPDQSLSINNTYDIQKYVPEEEGPVIETPVEETSQENTTEMPSDEQTYENEEIVEEIPNEENTPAETEKTNIFLIILELIKKLIEYFKKGGR